jgi:hypothetical protein
MVSRRKGGKSGLQAKISKLEKSWKTGRQYQPGQSRTQMYPYLQDVYLLYRDLRETDGGASAVRKHVAKDFNLEPRKNHHALRLLINLSATKEAAKTKSRWVLALKYIWRNRHNWDDFDKFLQDNEGIQGCATKWSKPPGKVIAKKV